MKVLPAALLCIFIISVSALKPIIFDNDESKLGCTTVVAGPGATVDGSLISTHNADCMNCDFRIAKTPAKVNPPGAMKHILKYKPDYPHFVTDVRSDVWKGSNIDEQLPQKEYWASAQFMGNLTLGEIREVEHTHALVEGLFGIMNDQGVAIGESTCGAIWYGKPPRACPDCEGPQIDMSFLTIIALERCSAARCAIEMMGDLASSLGYYAADLNYAEGGEGLTVIDNTEAWVFHILPTEDGDDVIWVAQRVPDTHVTAIANAFIIRQVDPDSDDFLYSANLWSAAQDAGLWKPEDGLLDFAKVYGYKQKLSAYITRRQWRVMDLVAPSKKLPADVDWVGDGLPFSVEVDRKITVRDVMAIKRDYYQGSQFDLTQGVAAGPYGDPRRFDVELNTPYNQDNVTLKDKLTGGFERAISLMRTSYSVISVSHPVSKKGNTPTQAVVWVTQYAPHMGVYTPVYVNAGEDAIPKQLSTGSLWHYDKNSVYWRVCSVGNWAAHFFKYAIVDVHEIQQKLENKVFKNMERAETNARISLLFGNKEKAESELASFSAQHCNDLIDAYDNLLLFLVHLIGKYHDGYSLASSTSDAPINMRKLFYPKWWLKAAGYWSKYDFPPDFEADDDEQLAVPGDAVVRGNEAPTFAPTRTKRSKVSQGGDIRPAIGDEEDHVWTDVAEDAGTSGNDQQNKKKFNKTKKKEKNDKKRQITKEMKIQDEEDDENEEEDNRKEDDDEGENEEEDNRKEEDAIEDEGGEGTPDKILEQKLHQNKDTKTRKKRDKQASTGSGVSIGNVTASDESLSNARMGCGADQTHSTMSPAAFLLMFSYYIIILVISTIFGVEYGKRHPRQDQVELKHDPPSQPLRLSSSFSSHSKYGGVSNDKISLHSTMPQRDGNMSNLSDIEDICDLYPL